LRRRLAAGGAALAGSVPPALAFVAGARGHFKVWGPVLAGGDAGAGGVGLW
jgi:hypothetical protein